MKTKKALNRMGKYILCILCMFFGPIVDVKIFDINLRQIEFSIYCN